MSKQVGAADVGSAPVVGARMAGEERRLQILRVAMSLFSQRGFRGTTTKEIAQAAGVSEAMVFRHFATKEELYAAILDYKACASGMEDPCQFLSDAIQSKDDRAVFEGLAMALMRHHETDTTFLRLLTHAALEEHQLTEMFWQRNVKQLYEFLGSYIRERQREGALRNIEPAVAVRAFLGMVIHHSLNNSLWDRKRILLDITNERAAQQFTEILLQGITETPARKEAATKRGATVAASTGRAAKRRQTK